METGGDHTDGAKCTQRDGWRCGDAIETPDKDVEIWAQGHTSVIPATWEAGAGRFGSSKPAWGI